MTNIFTTIFVQLSELGNFWQKKYSRQLFLLSLAFILIQSVLIFIYLDKLPPELPLFYSRPWGKDQLASPRYLFLLPATSVAILFINLFFITFLAKLTLLSVSLLISSFLYSFLSFYALLKIINLIS